MPDSDDMLADDEVLYRRYPSDSGGVDQSNLPGYAAFLPNAADSDGISVSRALLSSKEAAARGRNPKTKFYICSITVREFRKLGLDVCWKRTDSDPGHSVVPELNTELRKNDKNKAHEWAKSLVLAVHAIDGPFRDGRRIVNEPS